MAFDIDDPETERKLLVLAKLKGKNIEETILEIAKNEYRRMMSRGTDQHAGTTNRSTDSDDPA
ncbi:MAG TPA: hypothetical protein VGG48_05155 [Rhizomicrobium sp.]